MKLTKHREDVKWLKSYPAERPEAKLIRQIAGRYHRLITCVELASEPWAKLSVLQRRERRVAKDAEGK